MVWFGANRVAQRRPAGRLADRVPAVPHADPDGRDDGHLHGRPRSPGPSVSAERIEGSARHAVAASSAPAHPVTSSPIRGLGRTRSTPASATRAPSTRCCRASAFRCAAGTDAGGHRQHRLRQDHARQPHRPSHRRHRGRSVGQRRRRPRTGAGAAVGSHRARAPAALPVQRHRAPATSATVKPDATDDEMWEALDVAQAADFVRAMHGAARRDRSLRAARTCPAASASAWPSPERFVRKPERLPLRRLVLRPGHGHRRPAARGDEAVHARRRDHARRPTRVVASSTPTRSSCSRTASRWASARTVELLTTCETYLEIVNSQLTADEAAGWRRERRHERPSTRRSATVDATATRPVQRADAVPSCGGRWNTIGVPTEKSKDFRGSIRRLFDRMGPETTKLYAVMVPRRRQRGARSSAARRCSATPPTSCSTGCSTSAAATRIDFGALHRTLWLAVGLYLSATCSSLPAGVGARRRGAAHDAAPAPRGRGEAAPRCRCPPRHAVAAATCSAASPTTSTTSRRACSSRSASCSPACSPSSAPSP